MEILQERKTTPIQNDRFSEKETKGTDSHSTRKRKGSGRMNLQYRSVSNGYWVAFLFPVAVYLSDREHSQSTIAAAILILNAVILSIFRYLDVNFTLILQRYRRFNTIVSLFSIIIIGLGRGAPFYPFAAFLAIYFTTFHYVFSNLIKQHPKSFSFGEGVLVTSGFAYMLNEASQELPFPPSDSPIHAKEDSITVSMFIQLLFFGTILGARVILLLQKPWKLFILEELICVWSKYCIIAFFVRIPLPNDAVAVSLLLWPFRFLFANEIRVRLITFWAVISFLTGIYLILKRFSSQQTTTIDRKVFHFAMVLVFLPGIVWDHTLIYCCSAVLFFVFMFLETIRVLKFETLGVKIGDRINDFVEGFRDKQDEGQLLLTPIYLLVGCSLPIWLTGLSGGGTEDLKDVQISACLAGILSIGIGDTFASIGGTYYGRTHWKDSRKTVEGTLCSIIAQVLFLTLLSLSGLVTLDSVSMTGLIVGSIINAVIEGNTDQIDNLVLPLVTFIAVHIFELTFR